MEKAESNHLTASSTWVSNQQTRTVGTDWQVYCLELIKKPQPEPNNNKEKKIKIMKEPKKISASPEQKFCSWLEMQLVVTCTKVCELLPGRVLSTELCFGSQTRTLDRYREVTLGFTPFPRTGHAPGGTPGELPARAATPWCLSLPTVPQLSTEKGQLLSLSPFLSFSFASRVPNHPRRNPETASSENQK